MTNEMFSSNVDIIHQIISCLQVCTLTATMASKRELAVCGFIRKLQQKLNIDIPNDIWMIFIMFYPAFIDFDGNTMNLTLQEKELITSWFMHVFKLENKQTILTSTLLYDYNKHGQTGRDFHTKSDGNTNTFTMVQTEFNGHIFGCFLSKELETPANSDYIVDDKAFLCVIRSCFKDKEPQLFEVEQPEMAYFNASEWGPAFGSEDLTLLKTSNECNCEHEFTDFKNGLSGNILCGGEKYDATDRNRIFEIKEMNTFTILIHES